MKHIILFDWQSSYQEGLKVILEMMEIPNRIVASPIMHQSQLCSLQPEEVELVLMDLAQLEEKEWSEKVGILEEKGIPFIILTMEPHKLKPQLVTQYRQVRGVLSKRMKTKELVQALQQVLTGQRYIHPEFGEAMFEFLHQTQQNA
jgi:DNA-binding NarL/FixJ family response regulator